MFKWFLLAVVPANQLALPKAQANDATVSKVLFTVFVLLGVVSVLVITIAGLMYALSGGDPNKTARAKNAIIFAAVGLIVAVLSATIVRFVIERVI